MRRSLLARRRITGPISAAAVGALRNDILYALAEARATARDTRNNDTPATQIADQNAYATIRTLIDDLAVAPGWDRR